MKPSAVIKVFDSQVVEIVDGKSLLSLADLCASSLKKGEICVVIVPSKDVQKLTSIIKKRDVDVESAIKESRYMALNSEGILPLPLSDRLPDDSLYQGVVKSVSKLVSGSGRTVRIFGVPYEET